MLSNKKCIFCADLKRCCSILLIYCLLTVYAHNALADDSKTSALEPIKSSVAAVVSAAESLPGPKNFKARRAQLRQIIEKRFDFVEMAKRSIGADWNTISAAQQQQFSSVFEDLLASIYLEKMEKVHKGMVKVGDERISFPYSLIHTDVTSDDETFPIDYNLMYENGEWRVYDVSIENISLDVQYRNQFAETLRRSGFPDLIKQLKAKVAAMDRT